MIELITTWYNERFLAPFFLNHWSPLVDSILVLYDIDTDDGSNEIIRKYPNAIIEYKRRMNDIETQCSYINQAYADSKADWVIMADADEFIFHPDLRSFLAGERADIVTVRLYQPFRHVDDFDLDPLLPIMGQRMHGDPGVVQGQHKKGIKPMIAKGRERIHWVTGMHMIYNRHRFITSDTVLVGQHWTMADPCFCVQRRMDRKRRTTEGNRIKGHGFHNFDVTEEQILEECRAHSNDPRLPE